MYFSEHFKIRRTGTDDWFDPLLDTDTRLFVDPFLIFQDRATFWRGTHDRLIEHFNRCFHLIAKGNQDPNTVPYKKALALLRFPEPREFCLGYTESGTDGAGGGTGYASLIASAMVDAIRRGLTNLRHFEELGVLHEGIGPDRISDLTCNVLKGDFINYTMEIVQRHAIETSRKKVQCARFDGVRNAWRSEEVDLPLNPVTKRPILLVPQRFLRQLPVLDPYDWWDNYEAEQLRNDMNYEVMTNVSKSKIVEAARQNPEHVRKWTVEKETAQANPYDLEADPQGVLIWRKAAAAYTKDAPLSIEPPGSQNEFLCAIERMIDKFKHYIEKQDGWKLLWNDHASSEKPEEAAQLLFKGIVQHYCEANDIVVDREVNIGKGVVDFKFSNGYQRRALLEIKKLHNSKFWNGLKRQTPSYLDSDNCRYGWFIAIQYREGGASKRWTSEGPEVVRRINTTHNLVLRTASIDAQPKGSSAKL